MSGCPQDRLVTAITTLLRMGAQLDFDDEGMTALGPRRAAACRRADRRAPRFMTDWQTPLMVLFTQAEGMSVLHETVYEDRFVYVPALQAMGGEIELFCHLPRRPGVPLPRHELPALGRRPGRVQAARARRSRCPTCGPGFSSVIAAGRGGRPLGASAACATSSAATTGRPSSSGRSASTCRRRYGPTAGPCGFTPRGGPPPGRGAPGVPLPPPGSSPPRRARRTRPGETSTPALGGQPLGERPGVPARAPGPTGRSPPPGAAPRRRAAARICAQCAAGGPGSAPAGPPRGPGRRGRPPPASWTGPGTIMPDVLADLAR